MNSICWSDVCQRVRRALQTRRTDQDHFGDLLTYSMTSRKNTPVKDGE